MIILIAVIAFALMGVVLFADLSHHTLTALYAALHGIGLAMIMFALFKAMWIDSNPKY